MPKYSVLVPFAGHVEVIVEADSEKDACINGYEKACKLDLHFEGQNSDCVIEWDMYDYLVKGNYVSTMVCETEAQEIEENENE